MGADQGGGRRLGSGLVRRASRRPRCNAALPLPTTKVGPRCVSTTIRRPSERTETAPTSGVCRTTAPTSAYRRGTSGLGWPERIVATRAHNRHCRAHRVDESVRAGVPTTMMWDILRECVRAPAECASRGSTHKSAPMSPVRMIDTSPCRNSSTSESSLRTRWRSQSGGGGCHTWTSTSPNRMRSPVLQPAPGRPASAGDRLKLTETRGPWHRHTLPDLAGPEVFEYCRRPTHVVGIRMCEREIIQPANARRARAPGPRYVHRPESYLARCHRHPRAANARRAAAPTWHLPGRRRETTRALVRRIRHRAATAR